VRKIAKTSKLKNNAWGIFSKYIRQKYAKNGKVQCITCESWFDFKKIHAGHFIPGRHNAVLFDERNVHPQCYVCNVLFGGNGPKYYKFMLKKYGQDVIDELENLDRSIKKYSSEDYLRIHDEYKKKYTSLIATLDKSESPLDEPF